MTMIAAQPDQDLRSVAAYEAYVDAQPQGESSKTELTPRKSVSQSGTADPPDYLLPPANLSMECPDPPHLKYNITAQEGSVLLSIWEPAPKTDRRVKPFLFMSRHRLPSEREAKKLLAHYLAVYKRATQAD